MRDVLVSVLFTCSLGALACERVREPSEREPLMTRPSAPVMSFDGAPAPPAPKSASTVLASATTEKRRDAGRCIEPLRSPPPPTASKAAECPRDPAKALPRLPRGKVRFPDAEGAPTLDVEIARTPRDQERGLMYRTTLGAERGMIFSFAGERMRTFWMKNTCIPLDMLFLASDGTVVGVLEQVPVLNEDYRSSRCPAAYVLEVNAGWSHQHGVVPGMKASLNL